MIWSASAGIDEPAAGQRRRESGRADRVAPFHIERSSVCRQLDATTVPRYRLLPSISMPTGREIDDILGSVRVEDRIVRVAPLAQ